MKKIKRVAFLLLLPILIGSCTKNSSKSAGADLLRLDFEYAGTIYKTSINGTEITHANLLHNGAQEVRIKSIEISSKALVIIQVGDKL